MTGRLCQLIVLLTVVCLVVDIDVTSAAAPACINNCGECGKACSAIPGSRAGYSCNTPGKAGCHCPTTPPTVIHICGQAPPPPATGDDHGKSSAGGMLPTLFLGSFALAKTFINFIC